jgi:hypothetical protein
LLCALLVVAATQTPDQRLCLRALVDDMPHSPTDPASVLPESPAGGLTAGVGWATTDHAVAVVNSVIEQYLVDATGYGLRELVGRLHRTGVVEVPVERGDGQVVDALLAARSDCRVISGTTGGPPRRNPARSSPV